MTIHSFGMNYDEFCKLVMNTDSTIRFAAITDESGETLYGGMRPGLRSHFDAQETRTSLMQAITRMNSRLTLMRKIGRVKYTLTEYEKVKRITIPINTNHLLFVSTDVGADHNKIIEKIIELKENKINEEFNGWT